MRAMQRLEKAAGADDRSSANTAIQEIKLELMKMKAASEAMYAEERRFTSHFFSKPGSLEIPGFAYTSNPKRYVAPLTDPPIQNGLTDCFNELTRILQYVPKRNTGTRFSVPGDWVPPKYDLERVSDQASDARPC